mgnify:CR=1 FL=1
MRLPGCSDVALEEDQFADPPSGIVVAIDVSIIFISGVLSVTFLSYTSHFVAAPVGAALWRMISMRSHFPRMLDKEGPGTPPGPLEQHSLYWFQIPPLLVTP